MKAVFKREFRSLFRNVTGWIFLAAFLFLFNLYFYVYNLSYGYPYVSYALSSIIFLFLIIIPVISMRIVSEDKKLKTDQLLYTAPVPVWKIIFGKFLALVAVFSIAIGFVCLCPLYLNQFGTIPFGETYVAILGTWLFGVLCLAIGLFVSALTESLVISAIGTFAFLFLGYMMDSLCSLISSDGNILTKILGCLCTVEPLDDFFAGTLSLTGLLYYVSATALFLFLTCQMIQRSRWKSAVKKIRRGVFSTGLIIVAIAVVVAANFGAAQIPEKYTNFDFSYSDMYSMSDETEEYLETIEDDITIYVYAAESDADEILANTLTLCEEENKHITVEYIDPEDSPLFYEDYTDDEPTENSLIVVCGEVSRVVDYDDIYEYSFDYSSYSYSTTGYDGEGQIVSALSYVTSEDLPTIYVLTGHGETDLGSTFTDAIEKMNITIEEVNLLQVDEIDSETAAVIVNAPTTDFSEDDAQKLSDYLAGGGTLIITASYLAEDTENLDAVLAEYNIRVESGMIFEGDTSYYTQVAYFLLPDIEYTTLTSDLDSYVILPDSRAITNLDPEEEEDEDDEEDDEEDEEEEESVIDWTDLFVTSESSYMKPDVSEMTTTDQEDGDEEGPFVVGAAVENTETGAKVYVFGSMYLLDDTADSMVSGTNLAFFQNIIGDFADGDVSTVSIPVKSYELTTLTVNAYAASILGISLAIALPVVLIIIGVIIWFRRRRK